MTTKKNKEIIQETTAHCLTSQMLLIHCILFFLSFEGNAVREQDLSALAEIMKNFRRSVRYVTLVVTGAQSHSQERKEELRQVLIQTLTSLGFPEGLRERIFFMGVLTEAPSIQQDSTLVDLMSVVTMRNALLEWLALRRDACKFSELNFHSGLMIHAKRCLEELDAFVNDHVSGSSPKASKHLKPQAMALREKMEGCKQFLCQDRDVKRMKTLLSHSIFSK